MERVSTRLVRLTSLAAGVLLIASCNGGNEDNNTLTSNAPCALKVQTSSSSMPRTAASTSCTDFPAPTASGPLQRELITQTDRDGSALPSLPQTWGGVTAAGQTPVVTQAQSAGLANAPFPIETGFAASSGATLTQATITRDLYHRFFENQMQINGGANDRFAAYADSGGLVMGHYDGSKMALWLWRSNTCSPTTSSRAASAARSSTTSTSSAPARPSIRTPTRPRAPDDRGARPRCGQQVHEQADAGRELASLRRWTGRRSSS
jgi:hypothetical protein